MTTGTTDRGAEQFASVGEWSQATFGTDAERGPIGPLKHLVMEVLIELLGFPRSAVVEFLAGVKDFADATDIQEHADVFILWCDASRRAGHTFPLLMDAVADDLAIEVGQNDISDRLMLMSRQYGIEPQQLIQLLSNLTARRYCGLFTHRVLK